MRRLSAASIQTVINDYHCMSTIVESNHRSWIRFQCVVNHWMCMYWALTQVLLPLSINILVHLFLLMCVDLHLWVSEIINSLLVGMWIRRKRSAIETVWVNFHGQLYILLKYSRSATVCMLWTYGMAEIVFTVWIVQMFDENIVWNVSGRIYCLVSVWDDYCVLLIAEVVCRV